MQADASASKQDFHNNSHNPSPHVLHITYILSSLTYPCTITMHGVCDQYSGFTVRGIIMDTRSCSSPFMRLLHGQLLGGGMTEHLRFWMLLLSKASIDASIWGTVGA